ncbi:MAG: hypothetical protein R8G34_02585 [Paracoccaceae bacterium]|nr:hypothetical protein [Paracoccaceae bacterium]
MILGQRRKNSTTFSSGNSCFDDTGNDPIPVGANTTLINAVEPLDGGAQIGTLKTAGFNVVYTVNLIAGEMGVIDAPAIAFKSLKHSRNLVNGRGTDAIAGTGGSDEINGGGRHGCILAEAGHEERLWGSGHKSSKKRRNGRNICFGIAPPCLSRALRVWRQKPAHAGNFAHGERDGSMSALCCDRCAQPKRADFCDTFSGMVRLRGANSLITAALFRRVFDKNS